MAGWRGVVVDFSCLFWGVGARNREGCKPRAVPADTVDVWRIERVKTLIS